MPTLILTLLAHIPLPLLHIWPSLWQPCWALPPSLPLSVLRSTFSPQATFLVSEKKAIHLAAYLCSWLSRWRCLLLEKGGVKLRSVEKLVSIRWRGLSSHADGCSFVLQHFDYVQDSTFDLFNAPRIDQSCQSAGHSQ